jgi:hypothetical protein
VAAEPLARSGLTSSGGLTTTDTEISGWIVVRIRVGHFGEEIGSSAAVVSHVNRLDSQALKTLQVSKGMRKNCY